MSQHKRFRNPVKMVKYGQNQKSGHNKKCGLKLREGIPEKTPFLLCELFPHPPMCQNQFRQGSPPNWEMPKKGSLFLRFLSFKCIIYIFLFLSVSLPMDDAVLITAIDDISLHFFLSARLQNTHQPASASCLIMKRKQKQRIFSNIFERKMFGPRNFNIKTTI